MKLDKKWITEFRPCQEGVDWLEKQKERDGVKVLKKLIKENKLEWANWTIATIMTRKQYLAYAIFSAEQVIGIYEKEYPEEKRPRLAIEAAKSVMKRDTKRNRELAAAARDAVWDAIWDAGAAAGYAARDAGAAAGYAAGAAAGDAGAAARGARYAAGAARGARYAAGAAWGAGYAAGAAARYAARDAARDAMQKKIVEYGITLLEGK